MVIKPKTLLFFLSVLILSTTISLSFENPRDPEQKLQQCRRQCEESHQGDLQQRQQCEQRCEDKHGESGSGSRSDEKLRQCRDDCQNLGRPRLSECVRRCEEEYGQGREEGNPNHNQEERSSGKESEKGKKEEERSSGSPYFFSQKRFKTWISTQHGNEKVLDRFNEESDLLMGIANWRLSTFDAEPLTFALPKHQDAHTVFYVARGIGAITLVYEERVETHDIREGDIMLVPAGTIVYLINKHSSQKLSLVKLLFPISIPGRFDFFFGAGGEEPESFYRRFSTDVLEAALNAQQEKIDRLFGKQKKGTIIKASKQQIKALGRRSSEGGLWPWGGSESPRIFNLLSKHPEHADKRGQLYKADGNDYQELRDMDVGLTFTNISSDSMILPFYYTTATNVIVVLGGKGWAELLCPHLYRQSQGKKEEEEEQGQRGQRYQRVRANLSPGTVFVAPPNHPITFGASGGENLQLLSFNIYVKRNHVVYLAGKWNVLNKMSKEAKELSFDATEQEVDEVMTAQEGRVFVQGPKERGKEEGEEGSGQGPKERGQEEGEEGSGQGPKERGQEEGSGRPLASILDFARF